MEFDSDDAARYSRLLVGFVLVPFLLYDLAVGLPDGAFLVVGAVVFLAAAGIHGYAGQRLAAGGWLVFGLALGLVGLVDVEENVLSFLAFVFLLGAGLLLLLSQRRS
ncbi:MAG: hypothetical protein PPP58_03395 [Natronomonas sp.]